MLPTIDEVYLQISEDTVTDVTHLNIFDSNLPPFDEKSGLGVSQICSDS